jgi:GntR family transcriptional regulator
MQSYVFYKTSCRGVRRCAAIGAMPASPSPHSTTLAADLPGAGPAFSPLYRQIKELLTRSLQGGEWQPGDAIPSEMDLAARYKVSQGTVRKAVDELATDNLLVRRQGKGTFVATHAEERTQYRFLRLAPDEGGAANMQRRLLDCRRLRAAADVARALGLKSGDPVVNVRRLLLAGEQPVVLDDLFLPGALFKGLTAERMGGYKGPMYRLFEAEFGVRMIRAEEKIKAVAADDVQAQVLQVAPGAPLLSVERLSLTYGDKPVELRRGLYRTDSHHYRNELM